MRMFARFALMLALAAGPAVSAAIADEAANETLARRFYAEFNNRNLDAFDQFIAADLVDHNMASGTPGGIAALKKSMQEFAAAFPDIKVENQIVIPKGDYVTVISRATGTHNGPLMGMPASNKPVNIGAIDVWMIKDGKLAEVWHVEELLSMMMQIGAIPGGG